MLHINILCAEYILPRFVIGETWKHSWPTTPVHHIAYIKTHKAASSTMWQILSNYALTHNLSLALPASGTGNKLGWPHKFKAGYAKPRHPDILCHHSRLSKSMEDFMPSDAVFITSLRDPAARLESAYNYYNMASCTKLLYESFIRLENKTRFLLGRCHFLKYWLLNGQLFDLGMNYHEMSDASLVDKKIAEIDEQFSLVVIVEMFDESLIVMRDLFGWSTEDLVYITHNQVDHSKSINRHPELVNEIAKLAREFNQPDYKLYEYFHSKMTTLIAQKPEYYAEEVKKLNQLREAWRMKCVKRTILSSQSDNEYLIPFGMGTLTYEPTETAYSNDMCVRLLISEVAKIRLLNQGEPINGSTFSKGRHKFHPR